MAKVEVPEIRLAHFGSSGSGKTTFLASYFGDQQRNSFESVHGYRFEAEDVWDGNQLPSKYFHMEVVELPPETEQFVVFRFGLNSVTIVDNEIPFTHPRD